MKKQCYRDCKPLYTFRLWLRRGRPISEHQYRVAFLSPAGEVQHTAFFHSFDQILVAKSTGFAARGSGLHFDSLGNQVTEHVGDIVVAGGNFLSAFCSGSAVSQEKQVKLDSH